MPDDVQVESGHKCATPARSCPGGAPDGFASSEIQNWDAGFAHVADGGLVVRDLLVPAFESEHGLVIEVDRDVFDCLQREVESLALLNEVAEIGGFPAVFAGQLWRVHLDAADADLGGEAELFVGEAR